MSKSIMNKHGTRVGRTSPIWVEIRRYSAGEDVPPIWRLLVGPDMADPFPIAADATPALLRAFADHLQSMANAIETDGGRNEAPGRSA